MKSIIMYFWQLPQNILGLLLIIVLKLTNNIKRKGIYNKKHIYYLSKPIFYGISLGNYIIIYNGYKKTLKHEYGHCKQSEYLGFLYLFVVGLPSITMNVLSTLKILKEKNYYERWPENWADKLGNVNR